MCVVLLFAALIERLICPFLKPLWFLRPPSLPLCVLAIVEGPFQGHPANTFAVLLATLVVDKQCLVARARRRGAERSKRIDGKGRGRDAHRNSARNKTRSATEKGTFRKREKRNKTDGRTDGTTTKLPKKRSTRIHALTRAISRSSPHSDHVDINHSSRRCHHCGHSRRATAVCTSCKQECWDV